MSSATGKKRYFKAILPHCFKELYLFLAYQTKNSSKIQAHVTAYSRHLFMFIKPLLRWCAYLLATLITLIVILALAIRFLIFPNIHEYKDKIADYASNTIERKVSIGAIHTGWNGISPRVTLKNVNVYDEQDRPALLLTKVDTELSWLSIGLLDLRLSELTVHAPTLVIRRTQDNYFYLAGVNLSGRGNPDFTNWLLNQSEVNILNAHITWLDELRNAPELALTQTNIQLTNSAWKSLLGKHQIHIQTMPSLGTLQPIMLDGYFIGRNMSNLSQWYGEFQAQVKEADLGVWRPWLDYPIDLQTGYGSATAKLHFADTKIDKIEADVHLRQVSLNTDQQAQPLLAEEISGTLGWSHIKQRKTITAKNIHLALNTGIKIKGASGLMAIYDNNKKPWLEANFAVAELHLNAVKATLDYFAMPITWTQHLEALSPKGRINSLKVALAGDPASPSEYHVSAQLQQLSFNPYQQIPGVSNLTAELDARHTHGQLKLNSQEATLDLKDVLRWPIPVKKLTGQVNWKISQGNTIVETKNLFIDNPHMYGNINAKYTHSPTDGDYLELVAVFDKGNAKYAHFYYPIIMGQDTLHWLDTSILSGQADNIIVTSKGKLSDFPYVTQQNQPDPDLGHFKVTANISNAVLDYGIGWPKIENLSMHMLFEGKRMELNAKKGLISGNLIQRAKVEIPDLDADNPILHINAEISGTVNQGLAFVNSSPVKEVAMGFTDNLNASGNGHLTLDLKIPMLELDAYKFKGSYQISDGTIYADEQNGIPELSKLNGTLAFTEHSLSANRVRAEVLGGPLQFNLTTAPDKSIRINASGRINDTGLKKLSTNPLINALEGSTDWKGDISINKPFLNANFSANLVGMAVNLPPPFDKQPSQIAPLTLEKKQTQADSDNIALQYKDLLAAKLVRRAQLNGMAIERGEISINTPLQEPKDKGLHLTAKFDSLDADLWLTVLDQYSTQSQQKNNQLTLGAIDKADVSIQTLTIFDRVIHQFRMSTAPTNSGLLMNIQSQELAGNIEWRNHPASKLHARFKHLKIPQTTSKKITLKKEIRKLNQQYPALDIIADQFELGQKKLGRLELNAFENAEDWIIQKLNISNEYTELNAVGTWHNWTRSPNTLINFTLRSDNIGKTLNTFGQPDMVKGGTATLTGKLKWPGSPHEFDAAGLSGTFKLNAEKGQISKVQPGAGRLLGLLSLQNLPRRLTLDFRDLFSEGFTFDTISATATATDGILRSDDFLMSGPAAEATIKGETNLKTETQHLTVKVTPRVSDSFSLSVAALAGGPIYGAAAFVAQKLLKDPFNKIASTEYVITGTWANPIELESKEKPEKPASNLPIR